MGIIVKNILIETHHSIRWVKRYHNSLYQIYNIITAKLLEIKPALALQIFFKALNDLKGSNGLNPTLLVFDAYPCITDIDAASSTINKCSIAMCKTIEEIRKPHTSW